MTYTNLSLQWVAIAIGLLITLAHAPGLFAPAAMLRWIKAFPRNYPAGVALTAAAGIWFTVLTATMDLGEVSGYRNILCTVWAGGTIALIVFVPSFLAVRGLGMLLLLATGVMLDAAFLVDNPAKYVITVLAYIWAIKGMVYVASPYVMRDLIARFLGNEKQFKVMNALALALGLAVLGLGVFVY
jgi:hypothetical protein